MAGVISRIENHLSDMPADIVAGRRVCEAGMDMDCDIKGTPETMFCLAGRATEPLGLRRATGPGPGGRSLADRARTAADLLDVRGQLLGRLACGDLTGSRRLQCSLHPASAEDEWLVVLTESGHGAAVEALELQFRLTAREAEVLYWVARGKTNRDIGDILGISPKTITKHLERVFEKMGVETRTAAAARVLGALPEVVRR